MTVQAPSHREWRRLRDLRHLIDASVTRHAADPFRDVDGMIEEHEVGQGIHALPGHRTIRGMLARIGANCSLSRQTLL